MIKRKLVAPFVMLSAGAVASISMFRYRYGLQDMLAILLTVLIVFYFIGFLITKLIERFDRQNEEVLKQKEAEAQAEGEVIEKEAEVEDGNPDKLAGPDI